MLSAISPSYPIAISVTGPIITVFSMAGGFYANIGTLPGYIAWVELCFTIILILFIAQFYRHNIFHGFGTAFFTQFFSLNSRFSCSYGFEALSITQWVGAFEECQNSYGSHQISHSTCVSPESILANFSFNSSRFLFDIVAMFALIFLFYLIGFVGLLIRVRRSR